MSATSLAAALAGLTVWIAAAPTRAAFRLRELLGAPAPSLPASAVRSVSTTLRELRRSRHRARARRIAVIELCDGLAAELVAGRPPATALANAAGVVEAELRDALAAVGRAGDVAAELDRLAKLPGAEGLRLLAGCWRIGAERGGMFGSVVADLASALRDEEAHRAEVAAQLAGPRATAKLLAVLPLLGLAMGMALGARPLAFLFGSLPGLACLLVGAGLDALGLWWTRRLAAGALMPR
ncbi:MAG TPA: type II secretion system F family protein [Streptosporangiaceae bacterium]|nr:type II secretion system F family protein [Streptosporangiaceae bacterium]